MRSAKVKFLITLEYEEEVFEYDDEDGYDLGQEIALKKEYLEHQREDLHDALTNADLVKVEITSVEEISEEKEPIDYQI